jgi:hypothetical protein
VLFHQANIPLQLTGHSAFQSIHGTIWQRALLFQALTVSLFSAAERQYVRWHEEHVNLQCPYCGASAITSLRKLFMGVVQRVSCRECGKKVRLESRDILAFLPVVIAGMWWIYTDMSTFSIGALVVTFVLYCVLHQTWVRLVRAE